MIVEHVIRDVAAQVGPRCGDTGVLERPWTKWEEGEAIRLRWLSDVTGKMKTREKMEQTDKSPYVVQKHDRMTTVSSKSQHVLLTPSPNHLFMGGNASIYPRLEVHLVNPPLCLIIPKISERSTHYSISTNCVPLDIPQSVPWIRHASTLYLAGPSIYGQKA